MERLSRDVTVGASCLLHHIVSQCEEGVKVLSRIIFYLLLGEAGITATDTAIQNRGTLEKTSYRKLCNYPGILYVSQYICAYISRRARGWKNANRGHRLRVRARACEIVSFSSKKLCLARFISFRLFVWSSSEFRENRHRKPLSNLFAKTNYLFREFWFSCVYKMIHK